MYKIVDTHALPTSGIRATANVIQHNERKDMECHGVRVKLDNLSCVQI